MTEEDGRIEILQQAGPAPDPNQPELGEELGPQDLGEGVEALLAQTVGLDAREVLRTMDPGQRRAYAEDLKVLLGYCGEIDREAPEERAEDGDGPKIPARTRPGWRNPELDEREMLSNTGPGEEETDGE